jgi:hypothetical protein
MNSRANWIFIAGGLALLVLGSLAQRYPQLRWLAPFRFPERRAGGAAVADLARQEREARRRSWLRFGVAFLLMAVGAPLLGLIVPMIAFNSLGAGDRLAVFVIMPAACIAVGVFGLYMAGRR